MGRTTERRRTVGQFWPKQTTVRQTDCATPWVTGGRQPADSKPATEQDCPRLRAWTVLVTAFLERTTDCRLDESEAGAGRGNLTLRAPAGERAENHEKNAKREWPLRYTGVQFKCRVESGLAAIFDNRTAKPGETIKATPYPQRNPCFQGVEGHKGHLFATQSDQTP